MTERKNAAQYAIDQLVAKLLSGEVPSERSTVDNLAVDLSGKTPVEIQTEKIIKSLLNGEVVDRNDADNLVYQA